MNPGPSSLCLHLLYNIIPIELKTLLLHIQLHQPPMLLLRIRNPRQLVLVMPLHIPNIGQPALNQSQVHILRSGTHPSAFVMAQDDNVLDLEHVDAVENNAQQVHIGGNKDVGNVAMDEELSLIESHEFLGSDAGIGTSDEEVLGRLSLGHFFEVVGILGEFGGAVGQVAGEDFGEVVFVPDGFEGRFADFEVGSGGGGDAVLFVGEGGGRAGQLFFGRVGRAAAGAELSHGHGGGSALAAELPC